MLLALTNNYLLILLKYFPGTVLCEQIWTDPAEVCRCTSPGHMDCGNRIIHFKTAGGGLWEVNTQLRAQLENFERRKGWEILYLQSVPGHGLLGLWWPGCSCSPCSPPPPPSPHWLLPGQSSSWSPDHRDTRRYAPASSETSQCTLCWLKYQNNLKKVPFSIL